MKLSDFKCIKDEKDIAPGNLYLRVDDGDVCLSIGVKTSEHNACTFLDIGTIYQQQNRTYHGPRNLEFKVKNAEGKFWLEHYSVYDLGPMNFMLNLEERILTSIKELNIKPSESK